MQWIEKYFPFLLSISIGTQLAFVTVTSVFIPNFLAILSIAVFFVLRAIPKKRLFFHGSVKLYFLFWMTVIISCLYSKNENEELTWALYQKILIFPVLFWVALDFLSNRKNDWVIPLGTSIAIPLNLYIYLTEKASLLFPEPFLLPERRFMGTLNNPNLSAMVFFFAAVCSLWYMSKTKSKIFAFYFLLISFGAIPLIIATASKKGVFLGGALVVYFIPLAFFKMKNTSFRKWLLGLTLILTIAGISQMTALITDDTRDLVEKRIADFFDETSSGSSERGGSSAERLYFVENGISGWLDSPLWGHGAQSFAQRYGLYSHNNYVELLYSGGLFLFCMYYVLHLFIVGAAIRQKSLDRIWIVSLVLVLLFMDMALVSYLSKLTLYWLVFVALLTINPIDSRSISA